MADIPDGIVLRRHRDLEGRGHYPWVRRALLALLGIVLLIALLGVFGQETSTSRADEAGASLAVTAPKAIRGGLLYQAHFTIVTKQALKEPTLVLNQAWLNGITVNTIEPSPVGEASQNGRVAFSLGHLPAGAKYELFMDFQVNPTTVGSRTLEATLEDGGQEIASLSRDFKVWP